MQPLKSFTLFTLAVAGFLVYGLVTERPGQYARNACFNFFQKSSHLTHLYQPCIAVSYAAFEKESSISMPQS